jgi:RNA polymerase sigma-70 factor, ECF subfamily
MDQLSVLRLRMSEPPKNQGDESRDLAQAGAVNRRSESSLANVRMFMFQGSDAELLRRLRDRMPGAVTLLHARFGQDVNRLVRRLLGADPDHEDIVHEVFIKLMGKAHTVNEAEALVGWVRKVAVNTVHSELRKRRVRRLFWASEVERAEPAWDGVGTAEGHQVSVKTYALMERMAPDERIAFVLRFVEGLTVPEIAEQCDCSVATVKRRIARASEYLAPLRQNFQAVMQDTNQASSGASTGAELGAP